MVDFETIKSEEIKFGNNNFIEVARKKAISEEGTNSFVSISRGFFAPDGSRRWKKSFTIPDVPEVVDFVCAKVKEMYEVSGGEAAPAPAEEEAPAEEVIEEAAPEEEAPVEEEFEEEPAPEE